MGFSTDLQGKVSHDALLRLLDDELKLLETMKKCLQIRIDGDQKYVESLSTFLQTWHVIMNETEKLIKRLQANVEDLHSRTLRNLCNLINSKKASKKFYIDERNHLEVDLQKLQDETQRQKQEYARYLEKYKTDKAKFDDATTKAGKGNKKYEDAKLQYVKTTSKLHRLHNNYLLSIQLMSSQQGNYLSTLVPSLLTCHEERQITMVESCKALLLEYAELTNPASTENQNMAETLRNTITAVKPDQYFVNFIEDNKTDQLTKVIVQFDSSLMDEYQGTLVANQLATDNTTEEMLKQKLEELKKVVKAYMTSQDIASDELEQTNKDVESLTQRVAMGNEEVTIEELLEKRQMQSLCKNKLLTAQVNAEKYESLKNTVEKSLKECEGDYPNALPNLDLDSASIASLASGSSSNLLTDLKKKFSSPFHSVFHSSTDKEKKEKVSPSYEETDATNGTDGSTASNSVDHVEPARQLEDEEWFHGVLPRDEVQRLLVSDGDYLVRESKNKKTNETQYVLSAFWKGHKHFIIQGGDQGNWRFEGPFFPSIQQLISYQHKSGLAVTSKSQAILHKAIHREDWELKNDDILLDTKIGNGNFGEVYKGQYKPRNLVVAVKTCRDTLSEEQRKKFLQEGRILKQYNHPNIVTFIGIAAQRQPVMIVMEYVAGGSLLNFLRKQGRQQTKKQLIQMCENAANGMSYLESKNCIHRDLAARNCLVGKNNFIKISDFGMSREEEEYIVSDGMKQIPIKWTAPEALNYGKYTSLCDVWSFGILMWEVFSSGTTPYQGMSNAQAKERIDEGYQMPPPPGTLNNVYQLMLRCWSYKAENRPHFDEIHSILVDLLEKY